MDKKPGPRLSAEQRQLRNADILQQFIAGRTAVQISRTVEIDAGQINNILKAALKETAEHRQLLNSEALAVYVTRLERLIEATWEKVDAGDLKAIEVARRLLEQQSRLYGLAAAAAPSRSPIAPMSDEELTVEVEPADELAAYRSRHSAT